MKLIYHQVFFKKFKSSETQCYYSILLPLSRTSKEPKKFVSLSERLRLNLNIKKDKRVSPCKISTYSRFSLMRNYIKNKLKYIQYFSNGIKKKKEKKLKRNLYNIHT